MTDSLDILSLTDPAFEVIRSAVRQASGISIADDKKYMVEIRLRGLVHAEGTSSMLEFVELLQRGRNKTLCQKVVEALANHETTFFRDHYPYLVLRNTLLPGLIAQNSSNRRLAIFCAGCASGQEPFSIAMTIRDHFPELLDWQLDIIGGDISRPMIERCRLGRYSQLEVNRGLPAALLIKYFQREGEDWLVNESLQSMVRFRQMNIFEPWQLPKLDLIFMRNVLIYFAMEEREKALDLASAALNPQGRLVLGAAESTRNIHSAFSTQIVNKTFVFSLTNEVESDFNEAA